MAKTKQLADTRPMGAPSSWARTHGTYIAGKALLDGVDALAAQMERKWGADRLRLLVSAELREKFDRQRYFLNQAVWHGTLQDMQTQCERSLAPSQTKEDSPGGPDVSPGAGVAGGAVCAEPARQRRKVEQPGMV